MDIPNGHDGLSAPASSNGSTAPVLTGDVAAPEVPLPLWIQRSFLVIFVLFCLEVGLMLAFIPWTDTWTRNTYVFPWAWLRIALQSGFARGLVTGIGLVDIWFGIWEAVQYRDERPAAASPASDPAQGAR